MLIIIDHKKNPIEYSNAKNASGIVGLIDAYQVYHEV